MAVPAVSLQYFPLSEGFLQEKTKTDEKVISWDPGRQHSKRQISVASGSVQGDLCKVKLCASQNPVTLKQMERLHFVPMTLDKISSPARTASLRQPLKIWAARGLRIYRHSPSSILWPQPVAFFTPPLTSLCGTLFPALVSFVPKMVEIFL